MSVVLDVSNVNPITAAQVKQAKPIGLICKATEGTSFQDKTYATHRRIAATAKIPFGGYLFLHDKSRGSEADYFLKYAKPKAGDFQPIVDAEQESGPAISVAKRALTCLTALEKAGFYPILYSDTSYFEEMIRYQPNLTGYRFWQADYNSVRGHIGHGCTVVLWQYTDAYDVNEHDFDASHVLTNLDSLLIPA